jgi:hypothetical protein
LATRSKRFVEHWSVSAAARFWSKVDKSGGPGTCWPWTGSVSSSGYGSLTHAGRGIKAHRRAWELTNGAIPPGDGPHGTCVCHRCDNPLCCNPAHLFLGTTADNTHDMIAKGRKFRPLGDLNGSRTCPERRPRGDNHWTRRRA